jgi:hypothetical protein
MGLASERGISPPEAAVSALSGWESFYVITGSAAGALTGLTFVVITVIAQLRAGRSAHGVAAFSTPTVVHFCVALFVSAMLTAPWPALLHAALLLGLAGLAGMAYAGVVARRLSRLTIYRPDSEDWLCYAILPLVAYATLVATAILLPASPGPTLFGVGAVTLLLLFIGIHNAWDTVTHVAVGPAPPQDESGD